MFDFVLYLDLLITVLDSTLRSATPLLFACLAGLYAERSGIIDVGLEGKMLAAAFASASMAYVSNAWLGLAAGVLVSVALACLHGLASINFKGNQVVSCLAINLIAIGVTGFLGAAWFMSGGDTPPLGPNGRFGEIILPLAESLADFPVLGQIYAELISGHTFLVYTALAMVPLTAWLLYSTRFGLRLRAVGENPQAVDTAGLSVTRLRYQALMIGGVLCGLGGTYLAIAQSAGFTSQMTAGRGFIGLAALIFANWRPYRALWACLLFGFLEASSGLLQGKSLPLLGEIPLDFVQAFPYILTVILLAGFIGRSRPAAALGTPFSKDR